MVNVDSGAAESWGGCPGKQIGVHRMALDQRDPTQSEAILDSEVILRITL